ncbi:uncharacterized protein LOC127103680 [Lathyrus oleraceus]|uniref:uncharacterized protein LOC127103680 n=1 Tax=Pisum sativum TaxID=3888 RepID=UPI0021D31054|nr:uncharacterized protein LOC127103680 [Pisum sativum]
MDYTAVNLFLTVKVRDEDYVPALIVDVYHTLYQRHVKRGGMLMCYAHLLYKWLISHPSKDITDVKGMKGHKWAQYLVSLTQKDIMWFPQIFDPKDIILSCGRFPNVPLIGSRECITYNPILDARQLGYPLAYKPEDKLLEGFILQETNRNHPIIQRIIHAWGQLNKGILKRPREEPTVPYAQWMKERVRITKLPFIQEGPVAPKVPIPIIISMEERNNLNATIFQLKKEKEEVADLKRQMHLLEAAYDEMRNWCVIR